MIRATRGLAATALTTALTFAPAAAAAPATHVQTASAGAVSATFSYQGSVADYSHERLTISRAGQVLYDQPVRAQTCEASCWPGSTDPRHPGVHVLDLAGSGNENVVLDLYMGGAHCCGIEQVFSYDPSRATYRKTERSFGDDGARLVDLSRDGRTEFLSSDWSFDYAFTDFAATGRPIQIESFSNGRFHDVTRRYPKLIARDAAAWMTAFREQASQHYPDSVGVVAAWAADEDMLGHTGQVDRFLAAQARAGHLNSALDPAHDSGRRFVAALQRFLRRHGYVR